MDNRTSRKRPWLAAVLAAFVTGLGHLYLRRWRRALGWLAAMFVAGLFVDPAAMEALVNGDAVDVTELAPALVVVGLSAVDAYLVARAQNLRGQSVVGRSNEDGQAANGDDSAEELHCPHCGKTVDPDLDFCQWCTESLEAGEH